MFVDAELGFLGASPDGIVRDEAATDTHGLLEIKCPVGTVSVETLASQDKSFCLSFDDSRLCLKRTHAYSSKVQMQMAIVDCAWADFFCIHALKMALAFSWKKFLLIKISGPELKLQQSFFYQNFVVLELLTKHVQLNVQLVPCQT